VDLNDDRDCSAEMYSVRRRKETLLPPVGVRVVGFPRLAALRRRARSRGSTGGMGSSGRRTESSPSKTRGTCTRSSGIPSSESTSMLIGSDRASCEANEGSVYCANAVFGMSRSLGGPTGAGRELL